MIADHARRACSLKINTRINAEGTIKVLELQSTRYPSLVELCCLSVDIIMLYISHRTICAVDHVVALHNQKVQMGVNFIMIGQRS